MKCLQISPAVETDINQTWVSVDEADWLRIESEALTLLNADLASKIKLLSLSGLSEAVSAYIGFEQFQVDDAVCESAYCVLGRPAYRESPGPIGGERFARTRRTSETLADEEPRFDDSLDNDLLAEFERSELGPDRQDPPVFSRRLRLALAWGNLENDMNNPIGSVMMRENDLIPRPPAAPLQSRRPNVFRCH